MGWFTKKRKDCVNRPLWKCFVYLLARCFGLTCLHHADLPVSIDCIIFPRRILECDLKFPPSPIPLCTVQEAQKTVCNCLHVIHVVIIHGVIFTRWIVCLSNWFQSVLFLIFVIGWLQKAIVWAHSENGGLSKCCCNTFYLIPLSWMCNICRYWGLIWY